MRKRDRILDLPESFLTTHRDTAHLSLPALSRSCSAGAGPIGIAEGNEPGGGKKGNFREKLTHSEKIKTEKKRVGKEEVVGHLRQSL